MPKPGVTIRARLGEAVEDYLKAALEIQSGDGKVTTTALARSLEVAPASVTGMIKKLAALRLVRHVPYQGIALTPRGQRYALEILRHHRLLELYLAETLGYTWDRVHEEADRLEHVISEELEEKIFEALGRPTRDPHGEPIPGRDGKLPRARHAPLSHLARGTRGRIREVRRSSPEMLRDFGRRGLVPDAVVEVLDAAPPDGPITVRTGRTSHVLGRELAGHVRVELESRPLA